MVVGLEQRLLMGTLRIVTEGIEAGFGEGGFFAYGQSLSHDFTGADWDEGAPPIEDLPIRWFICLDGQDPFERYVNYTYPKSKLSPRVPLLRDFFAEIERKPVGQIQRWDENEPIELRYHLPSDPTFATFIMGVIAADRELIILAEGLHFLRDDENLSPAATTAGFMERQEPVYTVDAPVLQMR